MCKYLRKEKDLTNEKGHRNSEKRVGGCSVIDIAQDKIEFYQTSKNGSSLKKYDTDITDIYSVFLRILSIGVYAEENENLCSYICKIGIILERCEINLPENFSRP